MPRCRWCHSPLQTRRVGVSAGDSCVLCAGFLRTNRILPLRDYMYGVKSPILFIDKNGIVLGANRAAEVALGKPSSEVEGRRGGEVVDCAHARSPGGCGTTGFCATCPLRNSVLHTGATGQGLDDMSATRPVRRRDETIDVRFRFATRLVQDVIMLRLDDMSALERAHVARAQSA